MSSRPDPAVSPAAAHAVSVRQKLAYGVGAVATMLGKQAPKQFAFQVYNIELGLAPHLVGAVLFLARLWDAITDPWMGNFSDHFRSRWGRRRPFLLAGALLSGVGFALLWWFPLGWSELAYFAYFTVLAMVFYTALTLYAVPWYALGYELSRDYHQRTSVMAYAAFFGTLAQIGVAWLYWLMKQPMFDSAMEGAKWVGIGAAGVLTLSGLVTFVFVREPALPSPPPPSAGAPATRSTWHNTRQAFRNRPFLILTAIVTTILMCNSLVAGLMPYLNIYYVCGGDKTTAATFIGYNGTVTQLVGLIAVPAMNRYSARHGKIRTLRLAFLFAGMGSLSTWFLFVPAQPYLQLLCACLSGFGLTAIFMLCHAMIGDVCDLEELRHGTRREGLFGAVYGWAFKLGLALAFLTAGYLLLWTGFDATVGADQAPETLTSMRVLFAVIPVVGYAVSYWLTSRFDLTQERLQEIRAELERRENLG
ncbi:MFS transporter [Actomonas aquatica]|uniref:MFS transporter n=1 Tax=Actomonas aquatica TaxID=2866162 RepID=A0ABZ1C5T5_9BACT|nr:MFS transporter [Opitutus sp. WL0086]WRQ86720.1 MFS transporter [Opitutus sp. WL0086]